MVELTTFWRVQPKDSKIGFPLTYSLDEISTIFEPFENRKLDIESMEYR